MASQTAHLTIEEDSEGKRVAPGGPRSGPARAYARNAEERQCCCLAKSEIGSGRGAKSMSTGNCFRDRLARAMGGADVDCEGDNIQNSTDHLGAHMPAKQKNPLCRFQNKQI